MCRKNNFLKTEGGRVELPRLLHSTVFETVVYTVPPDGLILVFFAKSEKSE